jgi:hypothetical protein
MNTYTESSTDLHNGVNLGWDTIIRDAKADIRKHERRIVSLREAIQLAQKAIKDGVPFDSTQK